VGSVLRTLSALSNSETARRFQVAGFPKKERKLEQRLEEEEPLYDELRKLYDYGLPLPTRDTPNKVIRVLYFKNKFMSAMQFFVI
jgi:hypothetical protein